MTCRVVFHPRWFRMASEVRWHQGAGWLAGALADDNQKLENRSGNTPQSWLLYWVTIPVEVGGVDGVGERQTGSHSLESRPSLSLACCRTWSNDSFHQPPVRASDGTLRRRWGRREAG